MRAWRVAARVPDPELPVLTIGDIGLLHDLTVDDMGRVHVRIGATHAAHSALETVRTHLVEALTGAGFWHVDVEFEASRVSLPRPR